MLKFWKAALVLCVLTLSGFVPQTAKAQMQQKLDPFGDQHIEYVVPVDTVEFTQLGYNTEQRGDTAVQALVVPNPKTWTEIKPDDRAILEDLGRAYPCMSKDQMIALHNKLASASQSHGAWMSYLRHERANFPACNDPKLATRVTVRTVIPEKLPNGVDPFKQRSVSYIDDHHVDPNVKGGIPGGDRAKVAALVDPSHPNLHFLSCLNKGTRAMSMQQKKWLMEAMRDLNQGVRVRIPHHIVRDTGCGSSNDGTDFDPPFAANDPFMGWQFTLPDGSVVVLFDDCENFLLPYLNFTVETESWKPTKLAAIAPVSAPPCNCTPPQRSVAKGANPWPWIIGAAVVTGAVILFTHSSGAHKSNDGNVSRTALNLNPPTVSPTLNIGSVTGAGGHRHHNVNIGVGLHF